MEEFVGQLWHKCITRASNTCYPKASIKLTDISKCLAIQFRAFGGHPGLQIKPSNRSDWLVHRSFLSRIASRENYVEFAWVDTQSLHLPSEISYFADPEDNKNLFLWLTALAANTAPCNTFWLQASQQTVIRVLKRFPGLKNLYSHLVNLHLSQRLPLQKLPQKLIAAETAIHQALQTPGAIMDSIEDINKLTPVPLWLHPNPPACNTIKTPSAETDKDPSSAEGQTKELADKKGHKGEYVDDVDGRDGLLAFRLESLMSWAEFVPVDRTADEHNNEEQAEQIANDLDVIAIAQSKDAPSSRLKFDLDLPSQDYDDVVLQTGIQLPEWDYRQTTLHKNHCQLVLMEPAKSAEDLLPPHLKQHAKVVKAHFENIAMNRQWVRSQSDGSELDIDQFVLYKADTQHGFTQQDPGLYRDLQHNIRDLSCLLLADLSLSTDAWINNEVRVIDVIRDSLHLFNEALSKTQDRFAISGFSSKRRNHIRYYQLKKFNEPSTPEIRQRINAITPGYYTRMGTAIRYASQLLADEKSTHKLLLLISDGKPNDVDIYEGRYGIEDTRHAAKEALEQGIRVFCVTIDTQANNYLPYIFGCNNYTVIHSAAELPVKLPVLYAQLTR